MTFEELKAEAKRQGYNLVKKKEYIKLLPCSCGCKRTTLWFGLYDKLGKCYYSCNNCDNKGSWGSSERNARENWNNADWRKNNGQ